MTTIETIRTMSGQVVRRGLAVCALCVLVATAAVTWATASPAAAGAKRATSTKPATTETRAAAAATPGGRAAGGDDSPARAARKTLSGKLNLNAASEDQLQLLPGVGPAKAERIVAYRSKKGPFKRVADLRNVKGFGYRSLKKLEPYLDVKGDTTLSER